jgi:hypothetical protein
MPLLVHRNRATLAVATDAVKQSPHLHRKGRLARTPGDEISDSGLRYVAEYLIALRKQPSARLHLSQSAFVFGMHGRNDIPTSFEKQSK